MTVKFSKHPEIYKLKPTKHGDRWHRRDTPAGKYPKQKHKPPPKHLKITDVHMRQIKTQQDIMDKRPKWGVRCLTRPFTISEIKRIAGELNINFTKYSPDDLRIGADIEREHFDVTCDRTTIVKIARKHLEERSDYYIRLEKYVENPGGEKWFKQAVMEKPPYTLGGWKKILPAEKRRKLALESRPKNWTQKHRLLSTARALNALANVTKDEETKMKAKADSEHFFNEYKKKRILM